MKKILYILLLISISVSNAQTTPVSVEAERIAEIQQQLAQLSEAIPGLTKHVKSEINVSNITLPNFLLAVAEVHKVNINVSPELNNIPIVNSFPDVTLADLLEFICKEFSLTIDFTGNILAIKKYNAPIPIEEAHVIPVTYNQANNRITIDAKKDKLYDVFKRIMDVSGKNLAFAPGLENEPITAYIINAPFDVAMQKLALVNDLETTQSKDGFWVFQDNIDATNAKDNGSKRLLRQRNTDASYKILDLDEKLLEVNFVNKPIVEIVKEIGADLNINIFTATPLDKAGTTTIKAQSITFDNLLVKIFESQQQSNAKPAQNAGNNARNQNQAPAQNQAAFNFKKEGNMYFFGTEDQLSIRTVDVIYLQYRSIELLSDPSGGGNTNSASNRVLNNLSGLNESYGNQYGSQYGNQYGNQSGNQYGSSNQNNSYRRPTNTNNTTTNNNSRASQAESTSLKSILPEEIVNAIDIKEDFELNCFYVSGPAAMVERFRNFITKIDKPIPVVLIEVMIIEVSKSATLDAGVTWGIGEAPVTTQGGLFPGADATLGAKTVNKIIGSFNSFGGFNLGNVGSNFFATIKAMETNGDLKIKSTPKLATLNSHRATFSNGQTSFYAVTRRNIYGSNNPQTSEITNYLPIDAELGISIKPTVSGDGQVLLDISVIQSSFGSRVAEDAPPDVISRNFSSLIRMKDQDIAVLGGLEEQVKSNSGTGVPFLAKVPVIKWLFSKRKRETSKSKLTILIKPTVYY